MQVRSLNAQGAQLKEQHANHAARLEGSIAALQEQNAGLRMDAATSASAFEADKLSLSQRLEDVEQELQAQVSELHADRAQLTEKCSSLQEHLKQQAALRTEAEAALAALTAEHEVHSTRVNELEGLHTQHSGVIGDLHAQLASQEVKKLTLFYCM